MPGIVLSRTYSASNLELSALIPGACLPWKSIISLWVEELRDLTRSKVCAVEVWMQ